jgi:HSP20 family protein
MAKLVKFDPFAEMLNLQRQFFGDDLLSSVKSMTIPTTDVYTKDDKELVVEAHLPNFEKDDVTINIEDGALVIQAEKHEKEEDKDKKYVVRESASSFYRRVALPERADGENIQANLDDGILKVTVPLKALPEPKRIAIESKNTKKNKIDTK